MIPSGTKVSSVTRNQALDQRGGAKNGTAGHHGFESTKKMQSTTDLMNENAGPFSMEKPPASKLSIQISQKLQQQKLMAGSSKQPQSTSNARVPKNSFLNHTIKVPSSTLTCPSLISQNA